MFCNEIYNLPRLQATREASSRKRSMMIVAVYH